MPVNNKGYDIESVDKETGDIHYIEVKGIDGAWGNRGVGISKSQYQMAIDKGDNFWLYIVENARSSSPCIYKIQSPVAKITEYRFDSNWRYLAVPETETDQTSEVIDIADYTDNESCKTIIDFCRENNTPLPEVGYEIVDQDGAVVYEFELAWEDIRLGVSIDATSIPDLPGWDCLVSENTDYVLTVLREEYGQLDEN